MPAYTLADRFERLEDDFGLKWGEIEFAGCNSIVDRSVDVFVGVFEGDSKAVEAVALEVLVEQMDPYTVTRQSGHSGEIR